MFHICSIISYIPVLFAVNLLVAWICRAQCWSRGSIVAITNVHCAILQQLTTTSMLDDDNCIAVDMDQQWRDL